ncbi:uncharacterized protein CTRU02_207997 [Colletotrichum truncatum]|uniref:Uncharacterized protein n=1 Tax=Colletotrichum truncatum TaxID=5467 RepID=A0ACC3Z2F4_COLTU|nr:uncharacterized protein CTRU02_15641 [Colletotrichum truncatum]KAF6780847.1 hypothetical protein CTRU02_15641 [Colletotrichum truncatum]
MQSTRIGAQKPEIIIPTFVVSSVVITLLSVHFLIAWLGQFYQQPWQQT